MKISGVLLLLLVLCVVYATARRVEYKRGQGEIKSMRLGAGFGTPLQGKDFDSKKLRSKPTKEQVEQMRFKPSEKKHLSAFSKPTVHVDLIKSVTSTKIKLTNRVQMSESVQKKWNITSEAQKKNFWEGESEDFYPFNSAPLFADEDRYSFPYSTVGLVVVWHYVDDWCGDEYIEWEAVFSCTGTVVGPSMVLTESLCAVGLGERVTFYPSWKFTDARNSFEGTSVGVWEAIWGYDYEKPSRDIDFEFGLLVIERKTPAEAPAETYTLGSQTGWLGLTLGSHYEVHSMVGYALNPLWFSGLGPKRGPGSLVEIATIISDLKVSQALPACEDADGILFPTDMLTIGTPMILNLGPAGYDFAGDEGISGRLIERNLVTGIVSSYNGFGSIFGTGSGSGVFGTVMQPFGDEFAEVYGDLCQDFCWACPPYYQEDRSLSQAPAHPHVGNGILSTPEFAFPSLRRAKSQPKGSVPSLPTTGHKASISLVTRNTIKVSQNMARSFSNSSVQEKNSIIKDGPFSSSPIIVASNRFQFPYSALGKVFTFDAASGDLVSHCTGAVIGPRMVLAAPECLCPVQNTQYRWEFYPAWQQLSFDSDELIGTSLGKFEGEAAYTNTDHFDGYYSSNGGILVTKVVSDPKFSWRTYNVGGVTGWFGIDFALGDNDMRYNLMTQAAYSESHFPGRIQVATTPLGGYGSINAPAGTLDTAAYGYYTDILRTAGVPTIINFGPLNRDVGDIGEIKGEYVRRNVIGGLGGIPDDQVTSDDNANTWTQPLGPWFYNIKDEACSHCEACGDITTGFWLDDLLATGPYYVQSNEVENQCFYLHYTPKSTDERGVGDCCFIGKRAGLRSERGSCCLKRGPIGLDECDIFPIP